MQQRGLLLSRRSETGFFSYGHEVFVCATAFHGAMGLICETKTRFLMSYLSSYQRRPARESSNLHELAENEAQLPDFVRQSLAALHGRRR